MPYMACNKNVHNTSTTIHMHETEQEAGTCTTTVYTNYCTAHRHTDPAEYTQTLYIHTQDIPHSDIYAIDELNYLLQFQKNILLLRLAQLPYQHFILIHDSKLQPTDCVYGFDR